MRCGEGAWTRWEGISFTGGLVEVFDNEAVEADVPDMLVVAAVESQYKAYGIHCLCMSRSEWDSREVN